VQQAKEESSIHKTMVASLSTINKRKHELEVSTYSKGFTEGRIQRKQTRDAVCSGGIIRLSVSEEKSTKQKRMENWTIEEPVEHTQKKYSITAQQITMLGIHISNAMTLS